MNIKQIIPAVNWFAGYSDENDNANQSIPLVCWALLEASSTSHTKIQGIILDDDNNMIPAKEYTPDGCSFELYYYDNLMDVSIKNIEGSEVVFEMDDDPIGVEEDDDEGPTHLN